jgi:plasmid stabilization system protein ParE
MQLNLHRLAESEYFKICRQLGQESIVKRNRFDRSLREAFARIRDNPHLGSPSVHSSRWVRVGRLIGSFIASYFMMI